MNYFDADKVLKARLMRRTVPFIPIQVFDLPLLEGVTVVSRPPTLGDSSLDLDRLPSGGPVLFGEDKT